MGLTKEQLIAAAWSLSGFSRDADVRVYPPGDKYEERGRVAVSADWHVETYYNGHVSNQRDFCDGDVVIRALILKALKGE